MKTKYVFLCLFGFCFFFPLYKKKIPNKFKKMTFGVFCVGDNEVTEFAVTASVFCGTKKQRSAEEVKQMQTCTCAHARSQVSG